MDFGSRKESVRGKRGNERMNNKAFNVLEAIGGIATANLGGFVANGGPDTVDHKQECANAYDTTTEAMRLGIDEWYKIGAGTLSVVIFDSLKTHLPGKCFELHSVF